VKYKVDDCFWYQDDYRFVIVDGCDTEDNYVLSGLDNRKAVDDYYSFEEKDLDNMVQIFVYDYDYLLNLQKMFRLKILYVTTEWKDIFPKHWLEPMTNRDKILEVFGEMGENFITTSFEQMDENQKIFWDKWMKLKYKEC